MCAKRCVMAVSTLTLLNLQANRHPTAERKSVDAGVKSTFANLYEGN